MRTSNIVFRKLRRMEGYTYDTATISGVSIKSTILLLITLVSACLSIIFLSALSMQSMLLYALATIATVVLQLIIVFKPATAKNLSIPYAICEGLIIGVICDLMELALPGEGFALAGGALMITIGIVLAACILYSHAGLRAKSGFIKFFIILLLGFSIASAFFSLTALIIRLTTGISLWSIYLGSSLSIAVSFIMVVVASIYVFITIQQTNEIVNQGIDKNYEWYAAFGIAITVIWLFLEILELLLKIAAKRDD
ncbi:MAG: Bax inhibitor-1/YccA family protein [Bacilli bacterium]|nr:Bax inhibitor-1/YccA family protein [Bacilli bacterium]